MTKKSGNKVGRKTLFELAALRAYLPQSKQRLPLTVPLLKEAVDRLRDGCKAALRRRQVLEGSLPDEAAQEVIARCITRRLIRRVDARRGTLGQMMFGVLNRTVGDVAKDRLLTPPPKPWMVPRETISVDPDEDAQGNEDVGAVAFCFRLLDNSDRDALNVRFGGLFGMEPPVEEPDNKTQCRATRALRKLRLLIASYWALQRHGLPVEWLRLA